MARSLHFDADLLTGGNDTANVDVSISHVLGRVPMDAFVVYIDRNAAVYRGSAAWTTTTISVRVSAARTTFKLLLF